MNSDIERKNSLCENLKKQVYNNNLKQINGFEYSCFKFKFKICDIQYQKEFSNFLHFSKDPLLPWDIINWFEQRNTRCSVSFRRCSKIDFKSNYVLFKTILFLRKELILIRIRRALGGNKYVDR